MVRKSLLESVHSVAVSRFKLSWILLNLNTTALSASIEQRYAAQSPAARVRFAQIRNPRKNPLEPRAPRSKKLTFVWVPPMRSNVIHAINVWKVSLSFFLKWRLKWKTKLYVNISQLVQVSTDLLSSLSQITKMWIYVYVQVHRCVSHIETSLEEQKSSEKASTKRWIAQAPAVLVSAFMLHFGFIPDYRSCWRLRVTISSSVTGDHHRKCDRWPSPQVWQFGCSSC